jgi:hypothetical protein
MSESSLPIVSADGPGMVALLKIGELILVLPQGEICAMEAAATIDSAAAKPCSVGWVNYAEQRWPAYGFSEDLALLTELPAERRTCVVLALDLGYIGILCDDLAMTQPTARRCHELPAPMKLPASPIDEVQVFEDGIACITSARRLAGYIRHVGGDAALEQ